MRLRRELAAVIFGVLAVGGLTLPTSEGAQAATYLSICVGSNGGGLCLNDWNGASSGPVKLYAHGVANDSFTISRLTGYCNNGSVDNSPACPFWNGSGWNSQLYGGEIFQIKSNVSGACIGTDGYGNLNMGPCPPSSGGGGSNIWVAAAINGCYMSSGNLVLVSVYWVNRNRNAVPNNDIVYANGGSASQPFVQGGGTDSGTCFDYGHR